LDIKEQFILEFIEQRFVQDISLSMN
jgi:hypothetical protein